MELDETVNPPLETVLRFEGTRLESQTGDPLLVNLELHFRSFLAREPYQALTRVVAEVLESKSTFSVPADTETRYLVKEVGDTTGQALLRPFQASCARGFAYVGHSFDLRPIPWLEIEIPEASSARDDPQQRIWGTGFAFSDIGLRTLAVPLACCEKQGRPLEHETTPAHVYGVAVSGAPGRFLVFPGHNTTPRRLMREMVSRDLTVPLPDPVWTAFPNNCLTVPAGTFEDADSLGRAYSDLCSLLRAVTGWDPSGVSVLNPTGEGRVIGRYGLFEPGEDESRRHFPTVPFSNSRLSLGLLLTDCWPRIEHLSRVEFNFGSVAGWYHRGKTVNPIEQGFLNLFVFLESLKAHWLSLRDGVSMTELSTDFAGNVNRTLRELLGQKKKVNSLTEFRNRMVHQGLSELPRGELIDKYWELYRLSSAALLSLIGWTDEWHAPSGNRMKSLKAWWTVADLGELLPLPRSIEGSDESAVRGAVDSSASD